ncbi:MAG: hypothetical protein AVDCRST_MAG67-2531 [uncultured Solirubrobacteraceae bacterium]|uniref:Uncharacterized protein n=1 Tax=uncultured Solirubrobacteraceae bacterium TaxID=1162706 RepID=A0A6J4SWL9_9ACTN|nr:MAG: hypothetical protein AVDCRST_MAG67-2531 [uncultured Solirubrobacteraceae bacterium]
MDAFAVRAEDHDRLDGTVHGPESVRCPDGELDGFSGLDRQVVSTEGRRCIA